MTKYSAELLSSYIVKKQIDFVTLPAKLLPILQFISSSSLKILVIAGEQCDKSIMDQWSKSRRLINAYGPTECTVCASMNEHSLASLSSDIGQSVENAKFRKPVRPGDGVKLHVAKSTSKGPLWKFAGKALVDGRGVAQVAPGSG